MKPTAVQLRPVRRARPLLGTRVEIAVHAEADPHAAIDAAFAAITRVHVAMSYQEPTSDIAALNGARARERVPLDRTTLACLAHAKRVAALTGLFNPCIAGSLDDLWLGEGEAIVKRPLHIDLSGIAKGFAVDRACAALAAHGIARAIVNAGGDLRVMGEGEEPIRLTPRRGPGALVTLGDGALASSDAWGATADGATRHRGPLGPAAAGFAAVIAPDCATADALTKVVLADAERAPRVLRAFGARAHWSDGTDWRTLA